MPWTALCAAVLCCDWNGSEIYCSINSSIGLCSVSDVVSCHAVRGVCVVCMCAGVDNMVLSKHATIVRGFSCFACIRFFIASMAAFVRKRTWCFGTFAHSTLIENSKWNNALVSCTLSVEPHHIIDTFWAKVIARVLCSIKNSPQFPFRWNWNTRSVISIGPIANEMQMEQPIYSFLFLPFLRRWKWLIPDFIPSTTMNYYEMESRWRRFIMSLRRLNR